MDNAAFEPDSPVPPSSIAVLWTGADPPLAEEIKLRLASFELAGSMIDIDPFPGAEWRFWLELFGQPTSFLIWSERIGPVGPVLAEATALAAESAPREQTWIVGVEGPISLRTPTTDYQIQLGVAAAIAGADAAGVIDLSSQRTLSFDEVDRLARLQAAPDTSLLFSIHKAPLAASNPERLYWLHTHGLERAGIPDFELHGVPERLIGAACELFDTLADRWIEETTPDPETPIEVGPEAAVSWRPWQALAAELPADEAGGWNDRDRLSGHGGFRAVITVPRSIGWVRPRRPAPIELMERLAGGKASLYHSRHSTTRRSRLAKECWGDFGLLFACRHPASWRFVVKLGFSSSDPRPDEHYWFEVEDLKPQRIRARLVSHPPQSCRLPFQTVDWHSFERVSDWKILTSEGAYDPQTAPRLFQSLEDSTAEPDPRGD